jgi:hypothetical protein
LYSANPLVVKSLESTLLSTLGCLPTIAYMIDYKLLWSRQYFLVMKNSGSGAEVCAIFVELLTTHAKESIN